MQDKSKYDGDIENVPPMCLASDIHDVAHLGCWFAVVRTGVSGTILALVGSKWGCCRG